MYVNYSLVDLDNATDDDRIFICYYKTKNVVPFLFDVLQFNVIQSFLFENDKKNTHTYTLETFVRWPEVV